MRVANGVNERLAVAYAKGLALVIISIEQPDGFLHGSLLRLKGAAVEARRGVPSAGDHFY